MKVMLGMPDAAHIALVVKLASQISDRGAEGLTAWANAFVAAHQANPGGLSIEVGTRAGGSAAMFIELLQLMYENGRRPPLWTVDPYGSKPYVSGDLGALHPPIYGVETYAAMKENLAPCDFHAHWLMASRDFFSRLAGMPYWLPGERTMQCRKVSGELVDLPIGEQHLAGANSATFILLDGEHSAESICADFRAAVTWLKVGGRIVIDNVDADSATFDKLHATLGQLDRGMGNGSFSAGMQWFIWERVK